MYIIDTDVVIDIQRGYAPAVTWFTSLNESPSIPCFVVMELIQDAKNNQQIQNALKLISPLPVIFASESDCSLALSNFTAYHLSHSLGLLDALISACAVNRNAILCTFNLKHYRIVPNLITEQPYLR